MIISYNDLKDKINDTKQRIRTELSDFTIACPYCGEQYHRVAQHAKSAHGIEIPTFRETYYYTTATGALANRILYLYAPKRDRYIQQYTYYQKDGTPITDYRTNNREYDWEKYLTTKKLIAHIRGTETYGGLFYPSASKVLIFDIDSYIDSLGYFFNPLDPWCRRVQRAQASTPAYYLIEELKKAGIPEDYIHIIYSGAKGFHIVLFFDEFMDIRNLDEFGNFIINKTKSEIFREWGKPEEWEDLAKFSIELRPEGRNGRGVKFPLGIHLSTAERMEFCSHRHYYPPVSSQYDYLLYETNQIEKEFFLEMYASLQKEKNHSQKVGKTKEKKEKQSFSPSDIPAAAPTCNSGGEKGWVPHNIGLAANNHRKCKHYSREELQQLYSEGLKEPATRHNVMLGLAILFKERGFSKGETFKKLLDFSREKLNGYSKSTEEQIKKDIGQIVRYTYERDYHLAKEEDTPWLLTDTDIRRIAN